MKLSIPKHCSTLIGLSAVLMLLNAAAQDRATVRDSIAKELDGVRKAESFPGAPVAEGALRSPNLHPSRVHFRTDSGATVQVCVDVTNPGNADSAPTTVQLAVAVSNPQTLGGVSSQTLQLPLPVVSPGVRPTEVCGGFTVPNRTADWDLHANATVDPNNAVAESDERDNQRWRDCRLYGPNPGTYRTSTPPC